MNIVRPKADQRAGQLSLPAVLVTGSTATQNLTFLRPWWLKLSPVLTTPIDGGMARLTGPK